MATSKEEICNLALAKIGGGLEGGGGFFIDDITGTSQTEKLCNLLYDPTRKAVLRRAKWTCAVKYAECTTENTTVEKGAWSYAYDLPSDYLGRCRVLHQDLHQSTKSRNSVEYDHQVVQGAVLSNVLTNSDGDGIFIEYIFDLETVTDFDEAFEEAFVLKFAGEMAPALLADKNETRWRLQREYEDLVLPLVLGENADAIGDNEDEGEFTTITCRQA